MLKALWTGEYDDEWKKIFSQNFELERASLNIGAVYPDGLLRGIDLIEVLKDKDIFIDGYDPVDEEIIKSCPKLKMILSVRDGPEENIDINMCTKYGIPVLFAGGRCVHSVAELNMTLMFNLACNFIRLTNRMRNEGWTSTNMTEDLFSQTELYRKTLSIIGLGRNGRELAKLANGIGMNVVSYDPYVTKKQAEELNVTMMSLPDAMSAGDYVTLLARVTPETEDMIGKKEIAMMKPTAYLINTGRSKLADEKAIFDALDNDIIKGAALDVFTSEPLNKDSRAYKIPEDKLLLTPHMAGISMERVPHQYEYLMDSFDKFKKGKTKGLRLYNPKVFDSLEFKNRGGIIFECEK